MPAWGIAYCLGTSWAKGAGIEKYHGIHARSATALPGATQDDAESALADAVKKLLPNPGTMLEDDRDGRSRKEAFKEAIRTAYFKFSNDTDILTIYVDAVLNLGSWDKWCVNEYDGATPGQVMDMLHIMANHIEEDKSCLRHPGFLCTLVNLAQTLSCPEMAERYAERLGELAGDAGFLHHTISRLQMSCGQYGKALKTSENSVTASFKYVIRAGLYDPYTVYLLHEYCNRIKIGIDQGELKAAMDAVKDIEDLLKRNIPLTQLPPLGFHMECLLSLRVQVLLRFGCWKRILCLEIPTDEDMYSMTTVITHFAKAIAYSALNDQSNARKHQGLLSEARDKVNSKSPMLNMSFKPFLDFVEKRLDGELLYREAELEEAELVLREAMELEFSAEGWVLPTSLTLGALYLAQKNWTEAMMLFSAHVRLRHVAIEVFPIQHNEPALCSQHLNDCWAYNGLWDALDGLLRGVNTPSKVYVKNIKKQVEDAAKSKLRHVSKMTDSTFSPRNIEDWDGEPRIATF
ncbi:hypothetical protein CkaCkLH20_01164 [Colletotrichum karsti]|uniref:Uncharacterized protein n=1 Tax=Colletotrichum karsti TaxID=1095194 RepID=A0A9P6IDT7_9PEZI|nr:uncharacterized protein CkaCkLH20_01164 [Colletotrichum karsti]KAF9881014.1 hypothetical protein CkaCkLH20_01164 [Colletotrichum karsti]